MRARDLVSNPVYVVYSIYGKTDTWMFALVCHCNYIAHSNIILRMRNYGMKIP